MLATGLLFAAFVCFILCAISIANQPRFNLWLAAGLACEVASHLFGPLLR